MLYIAENSVVYLYYTVCVQLFSTDVYFSMHKMSSTVKFRIVKKIKINYCV